MDDARSGGKWLLRVAGALDYVVMKTPLLSSKVTIQLTIRLQVTTFQTLPTFFVFIPSRSHIPILQRAKPARKTGFRPSHASMPIKFRSIDHTASLCARPLRPSNLTLIVEPWRTSLVGMALGHQSLCDGVVLPSTECESQAFSQRLDRVR